MESIMDITLVTSSFNDEVHGTSDDRKTGCGINLLKPENVIPPWKHYDRLEGDHLRKM